MRRRTGDSGVTLIELLVVMILLSVIGGIITTTMIGAMRSTRQHQNRVQAVASLQVQLERMSRDLRVADPIRSASSTSLTADLYKGITCLRRSWSVVGTSLVTSTITFPTWSACAAYPATGPTPVTATVLTNLGNGSIPVFTYTDSAGAALPSPTPAQIRNISITLVQSVPEGRAAPAFTTSVGVKNATIR